MSNRSLLRAGIAAAVVILLALIVYQVAFREADDTVADSADQPAESSTPAATTEADTATTGSDAVATESDTASATAGDDSTSESGATDTVAKPGVNVVESGEQAGTETAALSEADVDAAVPPSFDIIERTPFETWIIAGRSAADAEVDILMDDEVLATVTASPNGEWATVESGPAEPGPRVFTLRATSPDGEVLTSLDPVVLLIPEEFGADALTVRVGEEEIETLSTSGEGIALSIESVSYGEQGHVIVAGRAAVGTKVLGQSRPEDAVDPESAFLRAFYAEVGDSGEWRGEVRYLPVNVPYVIRVTATLPDGAVAQEEIRFMRAIPNLVFEDGAVVVQPGNSLWRIARRVYGRGIRYHVIYQANRTLIDDPDLIYPGQIFQLPEQGG